MKDIITVYGNHGILPLPPDGKIEGTFVLFTQPIEYYATIIDFDKIRTINVNFSYRGVTDKFTYTLKNVDDLYLYDFNCKTTPRIGNSINSVKYALAVYFASQNIEKVRPVEVEFYFYDFIK